MSLVSLLSIARSALLAHQRALSVTGQNVANAHTPGYSRQRIELVALSNMPSGGGVGMIELTRARDRFLDSAVRREAGMLGGSTMSLDLLSQVEVAFGEPSDSGISASLDRLMNAFGDLSTDPSSGTLRELVRQSATRLTQQLHQVDTRLREVGDEASARLTGKIAEVNDLTERIAMLNEQVRAGGTPELEDQRDALIDRLSGLITVRAERSADGNVVVTAGGHTLVEGAKARRLSLQAMPGGGFNVGLDGATTPLDPGAGEVSALLTTLNVTLPDVRTRLDTFTRNLVQQFNTVHRTGFTVTGAPAGDFFDAAGLTAGTIALDAGITGSTNAIAAASTPTPGDGDVATRLSQLAGTSMAGLGGLTLRQYFVDITTQIGSRVRGAGEDVNVHDALYSGALGRRDSVSGVSIDEEMVLLVSQQQAYGAAARLVRVADDMIQDLLRIV